MSCNVQCASTLANSWQNTPEKWRLNHVILTYYVWLCKYWYLPFLVIQQSFFDMILFQSQAAQAAKNCSPRGRINAAVEQRASVFFYVGAKKNLQRNFFYVTGWPCWPSFRANHMSVISCRSPMDKLKKPKICGFTRLFDHKHANGKPDETPPNFRKLWKNPSALAIISPPSSPSTKLDTGQAQILFISWARPETPPSKRRSMGPLRSDRERNLKRPNRLLAVGHWKNENPKHRKIVEHPMRHWHDKNKSLMKWWRIFNLIWHFFPSTYKDFLHVSNKRIKEKHVASRPRGAPSSWTRRLTSLAPSTLTSLGKSETCRQRLVIVEGTG